VKITILKTCVKDFEQFPASGIIPSMVVCGWSSFVEESGVKIALESK